MKILICDCTSPDFEELGINDVNDLMNLIEEAKEITKEEFLKVCDMGSLNLFNEPIIQSFNNYPNSFSFWKNGDIFFFENSRIEYFYKGGEE